MDEKAILAEDHHTHIPLKDALKLVEEQKKSIVNNE